MRGDDLEERKNIQDKLIAKFDREAEPKPFEYQGKGFIAGYKILQRLYLNGSKYHEQKKLHEVIYIYIYIYIGIYREAEILEAPWTIQKIVILFRTKYTK